MGRSLRIAGCLRQCHWSPTGEGIADDRVFACAGCGSEWVRSETWTPVDWTGVVPEEVQRERGRG